jgi:hypothetical protein
VNPLEAAIRAACAHLGADPETWRGFEGVGQAALDGLLSALPAELAAQVRASIEAA